MAILSIRSSCTIPRQNIEAGVYLMANYINKYGDAQKALVRNNMGEGGAARHGMRANGYSTKIVSLLSGLEEA